MSSSQVLPVRCADTIAARLRSQLRGGDVDDLVKYTRLEEAPPPPGYPQLTGHGSPIPAYATEGLWDWLLSKSAT